MSKAQSKKAGFSLVELMVVVAIIGILATIAVPNFQRFQAKAKQSNAKVELSAIYTTQKAFYTEYQTYHGNLYGIGFIPDGLTVTPGTSIAVNVGVDRFYATSAGGADAPAGLWPPALGAAVPPEYNGAYPTSARVCGAYAVASPPFSTAPVMAQNTFTAVAEGCPRSAAQTATDSDRWTIDDSKVLTNARAGI